MKWFIGKSKSKPNLLLRSLKGDRSIELVYGDEWRNVTDRTEVSEALWNVKDMYATGYNK
jgi:hypothetical protein